MPKSKGEGAGQVLADAKRLSRKEMNSKKPSLLLVVAREGVEVEEARRDLLKIMMIKCKKDRKILQEIRDSVLRKQQQEVNLYSNNSNQLNLSIRD